MARYVRFQHGVRASHGLLLDGQIQRLDGQIGAFQPADEPPVHLDGVALLTPTVPTKIIAIGPNYGCRYDAGNPPPSRPMMWTKPATCLTDPDGVIELPPGHIVNHEAELAIVIGKTAKAVPREEASTYIFGYTCMNDVTAGDFLHRGAFAASHYFVDGKIFDTFAPLGPHIETELDTTSLTMECRVNGDVRQHHSTSDFLFGPEELVCLVSQTLTLLPGDVISMGSPPGVGPIHDGDVIEVEIENIGVLRCFARDRSS